MKVPAIVNAGFPSPAKDYEDGKLDLNEKLVANPPATFFMIVEDDSMHDGGIWEDDMVIVDKSLIPGSGSVICCSLDGEHLIRKLIKKSVNVVLHPENTSFNPILVDDMMEFIVFGVVTYVIHKV